MSEVKKETEVKYFFDDFKELKGADAQKFTSFARMAEQAERYEDMCACMQKVVKLKAEASEELELEQRNMLSVAYKNAVGQRRQAWRQLNQWEDQQGDGASEKLRPEYMKYIEAQMKEKCMAIVNLVDTLLLKKNFEAETGITDATKWQDLDKPTQDKVEAQVFYLKMCGDYYRYLAEFQKKDEAIKKLASTKYNEALDLAENLPPTHPTRLGLALNASVCFYEIIGDKQKACGLAKKAFDEAIQKLDSLSDSTYKDSTLIMQLLRDNLTLWNADSEAQSEKQED